jgi:hypothetical protein
MYEYQKRTKERAERARKKAETEDLMPIGMRVFIIACMVGWMLLLAAIPIKI